MYKLFVCLFVYVASLGFNSHAQTLLPENDDVKIEATMPNSPLNQCDNSEEFKYKIIVKSGKTLSNVKFQIKLPDVLFEIIDAKLIRPDYTNINPDPNIINTTSTELEFSKSGDMYVVDLQNLNGRQDISFRIKTGCISTNKSDNKNKIKFDYKLGSEDIWLDFTDVLTYNTTKDNLGISIPNNDIIQAIRGEEKFVTVRVSNKGFFSPVPNLRFNILLKAYDNAGQINNNGQIVKIKSVKMYSVYNQIVSTIAINVPIGDLTTTTAPKVDGNGKDIINISFDPKLDKSITDIQEYEFKIGYEAFDGNECILNTYIEATYSVAAICGNIDCEFKPQPPSHSFSVLNPQIPQESDIKIEIESVTKAELCSEAKGSVLIKVTNTGSKPLDITDLILNVNDNLYYNNRIIDFEDNVEVSSDGNTINYLTIPHTSPGNIQEFEIKKTFTAPISLLNASHVYIKLYFSYNQETLKPQTQYINSLKINGKVCNVSTTFSNDLLPILYTYNRQQSITPSNPVIDLSNVASGVSKEFYLNVTIEETPATPNDWVLTGAYSNRQITVTQPINGGFALEEVKFNNIALESIVSPVAYYNIDANNGSLLVYLNNSYQQEGQSQVLALKYSTKCEYEESNSDFDFPITYTKQIAGCSTLFQLDRTATVNKKCKNNIVIPPDLCQNEIAITNTILKRISTRYKPKPLAEYRDYIPGYFVDANKLSEVPVPSSGEYDVTAGETIQIKSNLKPTKSGINGAKLQIKYTVNNDPNYNNVYVSKENFLFNVIKIGQTPLTRSDEISDGFFQFDIPSSLLTTNAILDFEAQINLAQNFYMYGATITFTVTVIPNCPSGTTAKSSSEDIYIYYIGYNLSLSTSNSNSICNYEEYVFRQDLIINNSHSINEVIPLFQFYELEPTLVASLKTNGDRYSNWEFDLAQSVIVEYFDIREPDRVVFSTSIPPSALTSRIELSPDYQYNLLKTQVLTLNKNSIQLLPVLLEGIGLRFKVKLKTILNTEPCVTSNGVVSCNLPVDASAIYNGLNLISSSPIASYISFKNSEDKNSDIIYSNASSTILKYSINSESNFLLIIPNSRNKFNLWFSLLENDNIEIKSVYVGDVNHYGSFLRTTKDLVIKDNLLIQGEGIYSTQETVKNITNTHVIGGNKNFYYSKYSSYEDGFLIEYKLKSCSEIPISIPFQFGWSCSTLPSNLINIPAGEILYESNFAISPAKTDLSWQVLRANDQFKPGVPSTKPALCENVYFVGSLSKMSDANVYNAKINANVAEGLLLKEAKIKKSGRLDYSKISDLQISGSVLDLSADVEAMKNGDTHLLALTYESSCKNNPNQPIKLGLTGTSYCGDNINTGQSAILVKYDGVDDNDYDMDKLYVEGSSKILKTKGAEAEVKIRMSKPYVNNLPIGANSDIKTFGISSLPSELEIVPNSVVFNVDKSTTFTPLQTLTIPNQSSNEYYFTSLAWPDNTDDIIVTLKVKNKVELGASISFLDLTAGVYKFSELGTNSCNCTKLKISVGTLYPRIVVPPKVVYDCKECIESFYPTAGNKYIISAWVKQSNTAAATDAGVQLVFEMKDKTAAQQTTAVFTSKKAPIDGWRHIEQEFIVPADASAIRINLVNDSGDDALFDDVRIHPFNAVMKSFVYDQRTQKISAELDERNYATFYEYDNEGQLVRVKKETEKGVMTIQESRSNQSKK